MHKVSVIIATYNCGKYIKEAIESVFAQTYQNFEIIITDDGSTDDTKEILSKLKRNNPERVIIYIYQENQGVAIARNTAFKLMTGEYVAFLDADDMWFPTRLELGVNILNNNSDIGLVHGNEVRIKEDGTPIIKHEKRSTKILSGWVAKYLIMRKIHFRGGTILFRKSCLDRVGYLDENLTSIGVEDRDLWYRIALNYKVQFVDADMAYYRQREESVSKNEINMMKGREYLINKYYPKQNGNNRMRRILFSSLYYQVGKGLLWNCKFTKAKVNLKKSIEYNPLQILSYLLLIKLAIKKVIYYKEK